MTRSYRIAVLTVLPLGLAAQDNARRDADAIARAISTWTTLDAPPGHESAAAALLARTLSGWTIDAQGNLIKRVGSGSPRRVVACGMDFSAYVVSQITDDGYVRLRRSGAPPHPIVSVRSRRPRRAVGASP